MIMTVGGRKSGGDRDSGDISNGGDSGGVGWCQRWW